MTRTRSRRRSDRRRFTTFRVAEGKRNAPLRERRPSSTTRWGVIKPYNGAQGTSTATAGINVAIPHGSPAQRVAVYANGPNLYHSLRSRGWCRYY